MATPIKEHVMKMILRWLRYWPLSPAYTHGPGQRAAARPRIRIYW